ncbi:MAG TPA: hypothetical protein VGM27_08055 [Acidobacteriaceae bacterium]
MKLLYMSVCALMSFVAASLPSLGQDNPWNGSWKMDASTLKYAGPTYSIATDTEGYTQTRGTEPPTKTVCDGQPKTAADGTTTTCTKAGSGFQVDSTKSGSGTRKSTISLSEDGNALTRKTQVLPPDDSPYTITMTSERVSGGPGMSGVWKQVNVAESGETGLLTIAFSGDSVAFKETDASKPTVCKLDGTEVKVFGTSTMAVKMEGPHTLKVTYRSEGKIRRENTFELTPDGKTITETDVTPEPSPSTTSMLFNKS